MVSDHNNVELFDPKDIERAPVNGHSSTPMQQVELLAPVGNMEKLKIAIHYGANAVYLGNKTFSLRSYSENFTEDEMDQAIQYAHERGVKVYVACNIYSRNIDQQAIQNYLLRLGELKPDAIIISDPGILLMARQIIPQLPIHLSTQANTTNFNAALFWQQLGVKRINVARELSLAEIKEIRDKTSIEIEAFVHGAMCISYSGRCLLSLFMAKRHSNLGMCCQPCRFKYVVMEETRPGQYFPIVEDDRGSYIFNSKDLCMIEYIPQMIQAGIQSLKIEGRIKGIHYLATVVNVYRQAIDDYYRNPDHWHIQTEWLEELQKVCYRTYCTGFYFGDPEQIVPNYDISLYSIGDYILGGKVLGMNGRGHVVIDVRSQLSVGDQIEILSHKSPLKLSTIRSIYDSNGFEQATVQPGQTASIDINTECDRYDLIRKILCKEKTLFQDAQQHCFDTFQ